MNICYLIQSYDEIPFLLYLLSREQKKYMVTVLNFGNSDLQKHLCKYQKKFGFVILENTLEKKEHYTTKLQFHVRAAIYISRIYLFKYKLRKYKKIIFFTPFIVPLVSIFGESRMKQLCYVPLPNLIKRKILRVNGEYDFSHVKRQGEVSSILMRIVGKHMTYYYIGRTRVLALRDEYVRNIIQEHKQPAVCNVEYNHFVHEIYPRITEHNTVLHDGVHVMYFEQHYCERDLVNHSEYINLIKMIAQYCAVKNTPFYVKAHPGRKLDSFYKDLPHSVLESGIPAELIVSKNTICLSTSSGALAHKLGLARFSLVNCMPFKDEDFRLVALRALNNKIMSRVDRPSDCDELLQSLSKLIEV